jgi:hypothetical protein
MPKTVTITQSNFSGGISDSPRANSSNSFQMSRHFDVFSDPHKLIPYRSLEQDDINVSTYFVRDFKYASTSAKVYGLGQTGAGLTKIVYKDDAITNGWTVPASSEGNGAVKNGCFVEFKDYMWGFQGTNQIFKWGALSGTPSITNSAATVGSTITSVANGVINSLGDAYIAYNNTLVRITPALAITDAAKTVPSNYKITSMCNWGNYLAIGCSPVSNYNGVSKVFIWDYASTEKFVDVIDWGEGELRVLETVEGYLVGITDRYLNSTAGAGKGSMVVQVYAGGVPQVIKEVFTQKLTGQSIPTSKFIRSNRLFWAAKIMTNTAGTEYIEGIWSFGRKNAGYNWALTCDVIDENVSTSGIQAVGNAANYFFIAHSNDGSIDKTDDTATYDFTSIYESQILNFDAPDNDKRIDDIKVGFAPIVSGQSLTVKIKWDDDTAWTTVGTFNTVGEASHRFTCLSNDTPFPSGKELKVRLESDGGLELTSYAVTANILD